MTAAAYSAGFSRGIVVMSLLFGPAVAWLFVRDYAPPMRATVRVGGEAFVVGRRVEATARPQPAMLFSAAPLNLGGVCQANVIAALAANGGALQSITLQPGQTFSFNATVGNPDALVLYDCAGVYGGSWCNLAAAYSQVARRLGLSPQFQDHGIDLGYGRENAVAIWNVGGVAGFDNGAQDLVIENTTGRVVTFEAVDSADGVVVSGGMQ